MQHARRACSFFLARLRSEVDRLKENVFPGHHEGPRKWLDVVAGLIDTAEDYVRRSYSDKLHPDHAAVLVSDAEDLGNQAYGFLEDMAGADATQIPHQIVAPFQRWVDALGLKNTIFFRAEHAPNYELWMVEYDLATIDNASLSLISAANAIDWPLLRVTVPSQALGMLPHFAVVAHELGHALEDEIELDVGSYGTQWKGFTDRLTQRTGSVTNDDILWAYEVLSNWVIEIKADAFGLFVAGPAYFFALSGFLELSGHGYGIGEHHPPSDMRRRFLIDQMSASDPSFIQIFDEHLELQVATDINSPNVYRLPSADDLFSTLSMELDDKAAAILTELIPFVEHLATDIFKTVEEYLVTQCQEGVIYRPSQLKDDLDRHLEPLCALIPPIEFSRSGEIEASSLASILNVGWAGLLAQLEQIPPSKTSLGDESAARMERLNELLLKALELSEARQLWRDSQ